MSSTSPELPGLRALLWPHVQPRLPAFLAALGLALLIAAMSAAQPLLTRYIIDRGLIALNFHALLLGCGGMLALAVLLSLLGAGHRVIYVRASGRVLFSLRAAVYEHLLRVAPRRLEQRPVGDLVSRLDGDIAEVQRFGTDALGSCISGTLTLAAVGVAMASLSWRLTLLVAFLLPLQLLVRHHARAPLARSTRAARAGAAELNAYLVERIGGARHVQAAAAERYESERLRQLGEEYLERVLHQQMVTYAAGSLSGLSSHVTMAAVFALGGWYALQGAISVGTLVAFAAYLGRSTGSAASLAALYAGYQRARVSLERVHELLALPPLREAPEARALSSKARGALRLEGVTVMAGAGIGEVANGAPMRAPEERRVLDALDLEIVAGSKLILQGESGAGKSTLVDCLRRFIEPDAGRIWLDGYELTTYRLSDVRRRVVVLEHAPRLFRGSILDNLRYGHEGLNEEQLIEAARCVGADEFIRELPSGYATRLGENGAGLSVGQRQRLAIARALLADPLIVVLDEATSGLEGEAMRDLHRVIDQAFPERTRIIVTHRLRELEGSVSCLRLAAGRLSPVTTVLT